MNTVTYIFLSILLISLVSIVGVSLLSLRERFVKSIMLYLVSFSTGVLLGNVFIHLLPEVIEHGPITKGMSLVLAGMILSFIVEKIIHWHHCHDLDCAEHVHPVGPLVLVGDAVHNILDGVLIATSFLISPELGIASTVAVFLHEIPQEFGDFAILVHSGMKAQRALLWNFISALTAFVGAGGVLLATRYVEGIEGVLLPLAAGNLLYIAGVDLIPELHKEVNVRKSFSQLILLVGGIVLIGSVAGLEPGGVHGEELVFRGTLERAERPAADISYDYRIVLAEPYHDPLNAFGDEETEWFYLTGIDATEAEALVGDSVELEGEIEWGYAESRVLHVDEVHQD